VEADELACKPDHGLFLGGGDHSTLTRGDAFQRLVLLITLLWARVPHLCPAG
jgi:hypothetical protein